MEALKRAGHRAQGYRLTVSQLIKIIDCLNRESTGGLSYLKHDVDSPIYTAGEAPAEYMAKLVSRINLMVGSGGDE